MKLLRVGIRPWVEARKTRFSEMNMAESNQDASESQKRKEKNPFQASDEHLKIMSEFIFKREGRPATLNEAQDALNNLTRLMKWLYEHRNDLKE